MSKPKHFAAMDQDKLKIVMMLTQRWIQDNKYQHHAKTMKIDQWLEVLTYHGKKKWNPDHFFLYEAKYLLSIINDRLTDRGIRDVEPWSVSHQSTHTFTYTDPDNVEHHNSIMGHQ
jgi:hypothetical protein